MLRLEGLRVAYGHVPAVRGVSFNVPDGEIVALVGANGAGKTSTLNALTGLVARRGRIDWDGRDLHPLSTDEIVRLGVVQIPQGRQLFPEMSVLENLEMGAFLHPASVKRRTLGELMERFPLLRERASQRAGTLSGGEQQIVAIGRALMAQPRLLLLDEPCLGLSPIMVRRVAEIVRQLNRQGLSILLVEQNAAVAFSLAGHVLVMENGRIALAGSPGALRESDQVRRSYLGV